ncbi:MAG: hypothetical protein MUF34_26890 [Polyangiaceae bacterium]|nr:hypothetical protein [Polyangiaceae bacterium]
MRTTARALTNSSACPAWPTGVAFALALALPRLASAAPPSDAAPPADGASPSDAAPPSDAASPADTAPAAARTPAKEPAVDESPAGTEASRFATASRTTPAPAQPAPAPGGSLFFMTYSPLNKNTSSILYGRGDVDVSNTVGLVAHAWSYLRSPANDAGSALYPLYGGGVVVRPSPGWTLESTFLRGNVRSIAATQGAISLGHRADDQTQVNVAFEVTDYAFSPGLAPDRNNITQFDVVLGGELSSGPWHVQMSLGGFVYNRDIHNAVGPRLGSILVLGRPGLYPPLVVGGVTVGYDVSPGAQLFVLAQEHLFAASIGDGNKLLAGAKLRVSPAGKLALSAGALLNRVHGPLVPPGLELPFIPLVETSLSLSF